MEIHSNLVTAYTSLGPQHDMLGVYNCIVFTTAIRDDVQNFPSILHSFPTNVALGDYVGELLQ